MKKIFIGIFIVLFFLILSLGLLLRIYKPEDIVIYLDHEIDSFEVVIARYNEDLSWVMKEFPNEKVTIYNKGKDDLNLPANYKIIKLPNIGREAHTYLYHIVTNYNQLAERTLFLQGDPFTLEMFVFAPLNQYKKISKTRCKNIIAANCSIADSKIENKKLKDLSSTKWSNTIFKQYDFMQFKKEFIDVGRTANDCFFRIAEANFAIDRDKILSRNIDYYQKILNSLDNISPVEGHYMERLWDETFRK